MRVEILTCGLQLATPPEKKKNIRWVEFKKEVLLEVGKGSTKY